eukprot:CAMPEP_0206262842 /NCGR_PEP_ID=MMETSP0047_2-20121206/28480_1 /ASSEMBLY_ACC=CAM_ASM_000192 /TAXON_ID=195065 /ORGANISM="Chroomonas mesostigmatica_cf, Strain CCMP1168" /LENGTH=46 /DNA_ID= /DNA_START= /DNA_END= /DNA_ORIENTATION=
MADRSGSNALHANVIKFKKDIIAAAALAWHGDTLPKVGGWGALRSL